ncbi:MAG: HEAT repeat domain-containing protein [Pirellulales bacterium]
MSDRLNILCAWTTSRMAGYQVLVAALVFSFTVTAVVGQATDEVDDLIAQLGSSEVRQWRDAARTLSQMGDRAQPAVAELAKALDDKDRQVCSHTLAALGQLGPRAEAAIPSLIEALQSSNAQMRYRAAYGLGQMGPVVVPALIKALQSDSVPQRLGAAQALAILGPDSSAAMDVLIGALTDAEVKVRDEAARALGRTGTQSVRRLLDTLPMEEPNGICGALRVFEIVGPEAEAAIPTILKFVNDNDPRVRIGAARALAYVGVAPAKLVPILGTLFVDAEEGVQHTASDLLMLVRPQEMTISLLAALVESEETDTVIRAARLLLRFGRAAESAVPALVRAITRLGEQDATVLLPQALGGMGKPAVRSILAQLSEKEHSKFILRRFVSELTIVGLEALPLLMEALNDGEPQVRSAVALALGTMGPSATSTVPKLIESLADDDGLVRASAAEAIGRFGQIAHEATPVLANALNDIDSRVREAAIVALGETATDRATHTTLFVHALGDKQATVRIAAVLVIGKHVEIASTMVNALLVALSDQDAQVRSGAAMGLATAGAAGAVAGPTLVECLQDPVVAVRVSAAHALGESGETNPKRLGALTIALKDASAEVQRQAVLTLCRLGRAANPVAPQLVEALENEESEFRILVVESFRPIVGNVDELLKALLQATHDSDREVKRTAAYELGEIGSAAQDAIPRLFVMIEDDSDRYAARAAVAKIGPRDVSLLIEKMKNESPFVRRTACDALNDLGPDAMPALAFLEERLADEPLRVKASKGQDYGIRRCVEETVKKLTKSRNSP